MPSLRPLPPSSPRASAYRSARQLGHSVEIAERYYVNVVRGIPKTAHTVEAAMQITKQLERVIEAVTSLAPHERRAWRDPGEPRFAGAGEKR